MAKPGGGNNLRKAMQRLGTPQPAQARPAAKPASRSAKKLGWLERLRLAVARRKERQRAMGEKHTVQAERAHAAQAEELARVREMVKAGADIPKFAEACRAKKLDPGRKFVELYGWLARYPKIRQLQIDAQVGGVKEAAFWAEVMLANGLQKREKPLVPRKYVPKAGDVEII